jgi:hypothetical protein
MEQIIQILELLRKPFGDVIEIMSLWGDPAVTEILKSPAIKSNKFISDRLLITEKYFQELYINEQDNKPYLKPIIITVLKQIIRVCKPTKIVKRF